MLACTIETVALLTIAAALTAFLITMAALFLRL